MRFMEEKIRAEGKVLPGQILKVGSFLNQQIDTAFLKKVAEAMAQAFRDSGVTKILTIESSGIAIAAAAPRLIHLAGLCFFRTPGTYSSSKSCMFFSI